MSTEMPRLRVLALVADSFAGHGGIAEYNRQLLCALLRNNRVGEVIMLPRLKAASSQALPLGLVELRPVRGRIGYSIAAFRTAISRRIDLVFCGHLLMAP